MLPKVRLLAPGPSAHPVVVEAVAPWRLFLRWGRDGAARLTNTVDDKVLAAGNTHCW